MPVELKDGEDPAGGPADPGVEDQAGGPADPGKEARCLLEDWKAWLGEGLDRVENFTREKPATGLALSFLAGLLLSAWFRRKS